VVECSKLASDISWQDGRSSGLYFKVWQKCSLREDAKMKFKVKGLAIAFMMAVSIGVLVAGATVLNETTVRAAKPPTQTVAVQEIVGGMPGPATDGTGTLKRQNNGVTVNVKAEGLVPGDTYTLWAVVIQEGGNSLCFAAGHIVGNSGKGNFSGHLKVGDAGACDRGSGLQNSQEEIHYVVRTHGPQIPGLVHEQISTFGGGCDEDHGGTLPVGVGYPCANVQVAIFPAVP
jgi:hypothetical protein